MRPGADVAVLPGDAAVLWNMPSITLRNDGRGPLLVLELTIVPASFPGRRAPYRDHLLLTPSRHRWTQGYSCPANEPLSSRCSRPADQLGLSQKRCCLV
jgi:hypothetical protein